jgi:hypothetical protein
MAVPDPVASAASDYAAIQPAAVAAATEGRPLIIGWLSRGGGAPLELITTAAPVPTGAHPVPGPPAAAAPFPVTFPGPFAVPDAAPARRRGRHAAPDPAHPHPVTGTGGPRPGAPDAAAAAPAGPEQSLLFPPAARGKPADGRLADLHRLVWAPCLAGPEAAAEWREADDGDGDGPGMFETALIALMRRPFGWLVMAEPTDLLDAETAGLRTELEILRRHEERRGSPAVEQTERRLAERGTFGAAGLWRVRVLAGAASPDELDVLAPLLAGAAELGPHPYRLRHTNGAQSLKAALTTRHHDPADGTQSPFFVTAGTLTALAGLPRLSVPGLDLTGPVPTTPANPARLASPDAAPVPDAPTQPVPTSANGTLAPDASTPSAPGWLDGLSRPEGPAGQDINESGDGPRLLAAPVAFAPKASGGVDALVDRDAFDGAEAFDDEGNLAGAGASSDPDAPTTAEVPSAPDASEGAYAPAGWERTSGPEHLARAIRPATPDEPPVSSDSEVSGDIGVTSAANGAARSPTVAAPEATAASDAPEGPTPYGGKGNFGTPLRGAKGTLGPHGDAAGASGGPRVDDLARVDADLRAEDFARAAVGGRAGDIEPASDAEQSAALPRPIELGAPLGPGEDPVQIPLERLRRGVLVAGGANAGTTRTVRHLLAQVTAAGIPWLVVDPVGSPAAHHDYEALGATVINPVDPYGVPVTVSPLAPAPGYPLHAHIALVSGLLDLAFGADEALSLLLAQGLREAYRAAGWDLVTGRPSGPALVPDLADLHEAVGALADGAGYDRETRARLHGVVDTRFGALRDGSAGRFLSGGHPAAVGELLRTPIVLATGDLAPAERALVTGALLIRLAEHLRVTPPPPAPARDVSPAPQLALFGDDEDDGPHRSPRTPAEPPLRHLLVLAEARTLLRDDRPGSPAARAAERFAALIPELAAGGTGTVLTERRPALLTPDATRDPAIRIVHRLAARSDQDAAAPGAAPLIGATAMVLTDELAHPLPVALPPEPVTSGPPHPGPAHPARRSPQPAARRSAACGSSCRADRPCRLAELREAERLATSPDQAWLRVWTEILALAFLTDNPLPAVPAPLRRRWRGLDPRTRECLLAQIAGPAIGRRASALRPHYDPARFTAVLAAAAASRLDHTAATAVRPGPAWVVPPLRWLHEIERLCPLSGAGLATGDHAPPLDFDLPGLPDWPGIRVGQRIRALRRHPLSMALPGNRQLAWTTLIGEPGPEPFAADLTQVLPGVDAAQALRHTAGLLEVSGGISAGPGWLEVVLSWPRRFVAFAGNRTRPGDAADGLPG